MMTMTEDDDHYHYSFASVDDGMMVVHVRMKAVVDAGLVVEVDDIVAVAVDVVALSRDYV